MGVQRLKKQQDKWSKFLKVKSKDATPYATLCA